MDEMYPVIETFRSYSQQMEVSYRKNRLDVFLHLASERFQLLRIPEGHPQRAHLIEMFREDTPLWIERFEKLISKKKTERAHRHAATGGLTHKARHGRVVNQVG